jgi:hypothetical protein
VAAAVSPEPIARDDWDGVADAFRSFFAGRGDVTVGDDRAAFRSAHVGTGFELGRDGTSRSFMPLHGLELRWDAVAFDPDAAEVRLTAEGVDYTYRVPPRLR